MKNASHWVKSVLLLALAWVSVPAVKAATLEEFRGHMPAEVNGVLAKLTNVQDQVQDRGWLSATASLFNQSATIYLYWPDRKDLNKAPIVVVPLTDLNAKAVFDSILKVPSELDVGLKSPILFWLPERFGVADLERAKMPAEVADRAEGWTHLPVTVRMNPGLNLFGVVAGGFLGDLLKPVNLDATNLTAGLATGKDAKGAAVYVIGLTMASEWKNPFGLDQTSITGAVIRVIKEKVSQSKTIETWGTARIKAKDYTVYLQRSALAETLAFDTREASLMQFFDLAEVVSGTLGLPKIPRPSALPLDKVTLKNDRYVSKLDPASPPKFDNMMFMGSKGVSSDDPKLYINSHAYVFGWQAGKGYVKASKQGVDGDFGMSLPKIGPIAASSGNFYLKVNTSGSEQAMGIKLTPPLFGELDLKASTSGLALHAAPSCPLRPFGFTADVTDLTRGDFPVTPLFSDCFGKALDDLVAGGQVAYEESAELVKDVTGAAAKTADDLYKDAAGKVDDLAVKRAEAWGEELGKLKAVQDAGRYASKAYTDALGRVEFLAKEIPILGGAINALTSDIDDLLKQVWKYLNPKKIWDTINGKKAERSQKISTRDGYLAEEPAAIARRDDAKKILDKKTEEAAQFPSPYVSASIAGEQESLLGALSQAEVQASIAEAMRNLPGQMANDASSRKALFDKLGTANNPVDKRLGNARQASESQFSTYKSLSDLVKAGGDQASANLLRNAKKTLISDAVDAKVASEAERLLAQTVRALPTMAYDKDVDIVLDRPGEPEMCWGYIPDEGRADHYFWRVASCNSIPPSMRGFRFNRSGTLAVQGIPCYYVNTGWGRGAMGMSQVNCKSGADLWKDYHETLAEFFFDPIDGVIRVVSKSATPTCLRHVYSTQQPQKIIIVGEPCPGPNEQIAGMRFRLVERTLPGAVAKTPVAMQSVAAGRLKMPAPDRSRTNLAPLKLVPRKLN